jgi:hypothetical protein
MGTRRLSRFSCDLILAMPRTRAARFPIHIAHSRILAFATQVLPYALCFVPLSHAAASVPIPKFASFRELLNRHTSPHA